MQRRWLALVALSLVFVALSGPVSGTQAGESGAGDVRLVDVDSGDDRLWPYTSRQPDFATRTLAINLVVRDDPGAVRDRLERRSNRSWDEVNESEERTNLTVEVDDEQVGFVWRPAHGAMRYTYVQRDGDGQWLRQRYQLHAGSYLGTRTHVRAYAPADGAEWTALQAHAEYWDWFRLRHTVTDVRDSGRQLESDFADQPGVTRVERAHATERGPTADGISVVHVGFLLLVASLVPVRRRAASITGAAGFSSPLQRRSLALFATALGFLPAVRGAGIALESVLPWLAPKLIAVPLYVALVVGLPVAVHRLKDGVPPARAFLLAGCGFLLGVSLDFVAMNVASIPARLVWHRTVLAVGLGAIAAGALEPGRTRQLLAFGVAVWYGAVLTMLLGFP